MDRVGVMRVNGGGRRPVLAAPLLVLALMAAPAMAQINPNAQTSSAGPGDNDDDPVRAASAIPGLSGYSRGLSLGASVSARYDSNIGRQPVADDGYRVRPQVSAGYGLGLGRGGLFVQGMYARDFIYGSSAVAPANRVMLGSGLDFQLSRCSGEVGASWRRGLTFVTDASQFGGFSQEQINAGFSAQCRLGGAFSINGSVLRSDVQTVRDGALFSQAFDLQRWSYSAGIGFGTPALGQFSLGGSISDSVMPGRQLLTVNGLVDDGLQQRSVRFGYSRRFGSKINASVGISYLNTQPSTTQNVVFIDGVPQLVDRPGFSGLGYDASVDLSFSPRLGLQFTAGRNTIANSLIGAQFTIANFWGLQADYRLGSRYTLAAGVNLRKNQHRGAFVSPLDPVRRISDDFNRYYVQFGGRIGERIRLGLDVSHSRRRSNPAVLNFNATSVGLNLGIQIGKGR